VTACRALAILLPGCTELSYDRRLVQLMATDKFVFVFVFKFNFLMFFFFFRFSVAKLLLVFWVQ
jgi:hypothetical protein